MEFKKSGYPDMWNEKRCAQGHGTPTEVRWERGDRVRVCTHMSVCIFTCVPCAHSCVLCVCTRACVCIFTCGRVHSHVCSVRACAVTSCSVYLGLEGPGL